MDPRGEVVGLPNLFNSLKLINLIPRREMLVLVSARVIIPVYLSGDSSALTALSRRSREIPLPTWYYT